MSNFILTLDKLMCLLWITTYSLALIGTIKYRYPLIAPMTQAIIAPFEFAVFIGYIINGNLNLGYVSLSYVYWTAIEICIIVVMIKNGYIIKQHIAPYLLFVCTLTAIMCYLVAVKGHMFFFSYFNTFIGEIIWFSLILKKDYPMKPIALAMFITKFVGDAISIPTYLGDGIWLINAICILLPILDLLFILVYIHRKNKSKQVSVSGD